MIAPIHNPIDPASEDAFTEVRYGETDQMGYAHHAVAVLWLEYGRVTWLRKRGLSYRDLEAAGVLLPVVELKLKYHAPGRFEDQLAIRTKLVELGKARISFDTQIFRIEADDSRTLLVSGSVELACVDRSGKIQRVPGEFQRIWEQLGGAKNG
jgi:acyl-CoA thioester hydrolase